jgi:hypothetical protein
VVGAEQFRAYRETGALPDEPVGQPDEPAGQPDGPEPAADSGVDAGTRSTDRDS